MAVYQSFYHLQREPFSISPDPSFLYASPAHREALAQLRYVVQERKGFAVITGEVGTGKTLLLRSLIGSAGPNVQTGYVFNPPRTTRALFESMAEELGIHLNGTENPAGELNRYFLSTYEKDATAVMIFDEAQSLSTELLEEIRLLTNMETSSAKLLQVILAGQPELNAKIDSPELRALRQRLVFRCSLEPLNESDTVSYISFRLSAAGADASPFTLSACRAVHGYAGGIPRLINVICDNAMLAGYASDRRTIDGTQIEEVAADLKLRPVRNARPISAPIATAPLHVEVPPVARSVNNGEQAYPVAVAVAVANEEYLSDLSSYAGRHRVTFVAITSAVAIFALAALAMAGNSTAGSTLMAQITGLLQNAVSWIFG